MKVILTYRFMSRAAEAMDHDFDESWPKRTRSGNTVTFEIRDARSINQIIDYAVFDLAANLIDRSLRNCVIQP